MNKIQKLILTIKAAIHLWKMGFFISSNIRIDSNGDDWGFYRINFDNGVKKEYAVIDIDFCEDKKEIEFIDVSAHYTNDVENNHKTVFRFDK